MDEPTPPADDSARDSAPDKARDTDGARLTRPDGALSLWQRISHGMDKVIWRTPLYGLRLRGKPALQLRAVPEDPVPGDLAAGMAILEGRIDLDGESIDLATLDFTRLAMTPVMADYVHSFAWLRDLAAAGHAAEAVPIAQYILSRWLLIHGRVVSEPAWRPDLCGRRIMFWSAYAPLILATEDAAFRGNVLNALSRTAHHLEGSAGRTPAGLPRIAAWAGLAGASLLLAGIESRTDRAEAGLARALEISLHSDGGIVSRSPADQLALVDILALLVSAYQAVEADAGRTIVTLARAAAAAAGVTLGDRRLSSWQGGRPVDARPVLSIFEEGTLAPLMQARDWGYQRMAGGATIVVLDAAPPPTGTVTGGGCASTLAFEMSDGAHRLIVNCGRTVAFGADVAQSLRSTAAHSTVTLADLSSTAVHPDGSLGRGVSEVQVDRQETDMGSRVDATHEGYVRKLGFVHQRQLALRGDGRELRGDDVFTPAGSRKRAEATQATARFHLAPGIEATQTADGLGALLRIPGGPLWQFRCRGGDLALDESLWVDGNGRPQGTTQLVVTTTVPAEGLTLSWMLRRAG